MWKIIFDILLTGCGGEKEGKTGNVVSDDGDILYGSVQIVKPEELFYMWRHTQALESRQAPMASTHGR